MNDCQNIKDTKLVVVVCVWFISTASTEPQITHDLFQALKCLSVYCRKESRICFVNGGKEERCYHEEYKI